jgi:tetratricopeptide (TPR) repeat protein
MDIDAELAAAQHDKELISAALALQEGDLNAAERTLRARLHARPTDVTAIRMMAELASRLGRYPDAEKLLKRALELAPQFHAARSNYVTVLHRQSKFVAARAEADRLIAAEPQNLGHLALKAAVLVRTGDYDEAIAAYSMILDRYPEQPRLWISLGHVLKTVGRQHESVTAYRTAIAQNQTLGDAWWSLANLKTVVLSSGDIAEMLAALAKTTDVADRYHLHFALGKALEDQEDWQRSFDHYAEGNRLRRQERPYDPERMTTHVERTVALFDRASLTRGGGHSSREPIFIVGLPRAGSTLIEQILASHSEVEGTMELPDIGTIAADLGGRGGTKDEGPSGDYLSTLLKLTPDERHALGQRYLDGTRVQRKTSRPRFIDKMPNNFAHLALIHLILPNAVVIDARRHPMANGFSAFKQHFSRGQGFTYDLAELGRYWRDYARLMQHFDDILPGRVYRVFHERLVTNSDREIRAMLKQVGLDFEESCLRPHLNKRAIRTASSEQVRQAISAEGIEHWRHYARWLGPLQAALGDELERYPV